MNFASRTSLPLNRGSSMQRDFRGKEKRKSVQSKREKKERHFFFNGFTVCFSGAGSCIITCLLVRRLSSSASQLKQPSVCSYFRKRRHTNQAARPLGSCAPAPASLRLDRWVKPSKQSPLSSAGALLRASLCTSALGSETKSVELLTSVSVL